MMGLSITGTIFAGVALACLIWTLYYLLRKTDRKIDPLAGETDKKFGYQRALQQGG